LASDGEALILLQKEFPSLKTYTLPSYSVDYSKKGKNLKFKLFLKIPSIILAVQKEHQKIIQIAEKENVSGIVSDNRFGVWNTNVPSVYITHQLKVFSGITTWFTSKIHQYIIHKFDECWVPDIEDTILNYSGALGHIQKHSFKLKYLGVLSRFKYQKYDIKYDLLVVLSGPEPQRSLLENKLLTELENYNGKVLFVRGILHSENKIQQSSNTKIVNYLLSNDLEKAMNQSEIIIARSGYSTIMDLAVLGKKAFFIPTPGQFEQEYLAEKLQKEQIAPFATQQNFKLENLKELNNYKGFNREVTQIDLNFFKLFECKGKF
jgi:UDP-N-acetylglucosamine transferase subunit ALG13